MLYRMMMMMIVMSKKKFFLRSSFSTPRQRTNHFLTDRKLVEAEHVVDSDLGEHDAEEVGPLVCARGDEEAAVAASLDDQLGRRRPLLVDQVLGAGLEVVEHVLLVAHGPGVAPRRSVLAAPADVGDGDDASVPEGKDSASDGERRLEADVEA